MTSAASQHEPLAHDELDDVVGGIIIVGGMPRNFLSQLTSMPDRAAPGPQPLATRILSFGR